MANILIDTNVFLDILLHRPAAAQGSACIASHLLRGDRCFVTSKALTDIYYVVRKAAHSKETAADAVRTIMSISTVADVQSVDIHRALELDMADFEDAVAASVAERLEAVIVTNNLKDFSNSPVRASFPE